MATEGRRQSCAHVLLSDERCDVCGEFVAGRRQTPPEHEQDCPWMDGEIACTCEDSGRSRTPWRFGDVGRIQRFVEGGDPYWITVSWLHAERGWVNVGTGHLLPEQPRDEDVELLIRNDEPVTENASEPVYGALARAEALAADDPDWMNCKQWPRPSADARTTHDGACVRAGQFDAGLCRSCATDDASSQTRSQLSTHPPDVLHSPPRPLPKCNTCTRSFDPDGKPLHYCSACYQDMP